jgi:hypothetical protein
VRSEARRARRRRAPRAHRAHRRRGSRTPTPVARATKTVLFKDSFAGTKLDASKWNNGWFGDNVHPTKGVNGSEDDCYAPAQVRSAAASFTSPPRKSRVSAKPGRPG